MNISSLPEVMRRARQWPGLVLGLVLIGGGACLFFVGHTSPVAPATMVGAGASTNPAMPTANDVRASIAVETTITEPTRAVVPIASVLHCTPRYRPGKRFSFNSTSTIGLS